MIRHFAYDALQGLGLERTAVNRENFRIPEALAARLEKITDTIYRGRGFHVLRGLNLSLFTDVQRVILYAGLTSYVANRRAINVGEYHVLLCPLRSLHTLTYTYQITSEI